MLLEGDLQEYKQSHSRKLILNRSLSGAIGMVCDVRLEDTTACVADHWANFFDIILIILTMVLGWLPLPVLKVSASNVRGYACSDLTVEGVILIFSLENHYRNSAA